MHKTRIIVTCQVKTLPSGPNSSVRPIGIDTPEVFGKVECGGDAASRSAEKLLLKEHGYDWSWTQP